MMKNCSQFLVVGMIWTFCVSEVMAQVPDAPENLQVRTGLFGTAVLHWDSVSGTDGYRVYKSVDGSDFHKIADLKIREFWDWALYPRHHYTYHVTSSNQFGESVPSNEVNFDFGGQVHADSRAVIKGEIVDDSTGLPLPDALISVFKPGGLWVTFARTDTAGYYQAAVDTGRFIIRADKFDYVPEWYDNARNVRDAFVIELHQDLLHHDSTFTADFGLQPLPHRTEVTVTGTVDSANGKPLEYAFVVFLRPYHDLRILERLMGVCGGFAQEHLRVPELGPLSGVVWAGFTDVNGQYTAHLLSQSRYIAVALKPGYWPQFFNDKRTPFEADRLFFTNDTSGIDFHLTNNPEGINGLAGSVTDALGIGVPAHVILLRKTLQGFLIPVRYQMTDSIGNYEFRFLSDGIYMVKTIPVTGYFPAWHSVSGCGVWNWHQSDTIHIGLGTLGPDHVVNKHVCVTPWTLGGFARVAGQVNENGGLSAIKRKEVFAASPVTGIIVYAVSTTTSEVVGYDVSEEDGTYSIENLPAGSYTIVVDKEGYISSTSLTVTLDANNNYNETSGSIVVVPDQILSVIETPRGIPTEFLLEQNYPNPFNPTTTIRFNVPVQSLVSIKIYNLIGQLVVVLASDNHREPGIHTLEWNGRNYEGVGVGSGIYFIKMQATPIGENQVQFSQIRKMVLVK